MVIGAKLPLKSLIVVEEVDVIAKKKVTKLIMWFVALLSNI